LISCRCENTETKRLAAKYILLTVWCLLFTMINFLIPAFVRPPALLRRNPFIGSATIERQSEIPTLQSIFNIKYYLFAIILQGYFELWLHYNLI
jgi:hypothetical protein